MKYVGLSSFESSTTCSISDGKTLTLRTTNHVVAAWPHLPDGHRDTGEIGNLLAEWAPDEADRHQILVTTPGRLLRRVTIPTWTALPETTNGTSIPNRRWDYSTPAETFCAGPATTCTDGPLTGRIELQMA